METNMGDTIENLREMSSDDFVLLLPQLDRKHIIDVRSPAEFTAEYLPGSINIPLDRIGQTSFSEHPRDTVIYLLCLAGQRSHKAAEVLRSSGYEVCVINGGIKELRSSVLLEVNETGHVSIERQVFIAAGLLILVSFLLSIAGIPQGQWLGAFIGSGLLFAGVSGRCGMAMVLAKAPWNRF